MNKMDQLSLIDGEFTPEEAKGILMHLYSRKINFHERKNFTSIEQTGMPDPKALKRIEELQENFEKLSKIMEDSANNGVNLIIKSTVEISYVPQPVQNAEA